METLSGLWAPILLSAVLCFVASSIVWTVSPHHKTDWKGLPDEAGTIGVLGKQALSPGQYVFPYAPDNKTRQEPAFQEKYKKGPAGFLVVMPAGSLSMAKPLAFYLLYNLVVSCVVAYVAGHTLPKAALYLRVFEVTGCIATAAYAIGRIPNAIWFGRTWSSTLKEVADGILYGLLTAGTFGWLWPR